MCISQKPRSPSTREGLLIVNKEHSNGPKYGRNSILFYGAGCFIAVLMAANWAASHVADRTFLLNVIVQTSSVMIGFTSLVAVFVFQTSIQRERDAASDYHRTFIELQTTKRSAEVSSKDQKVSKDTDVAWQLKNLMETLKRRGEGERDFRKKIASVVFFFIVIFTLTLFTSIIVGAGSWDLIWLPLGLTVFGAIYLPVFLLLFFMCSYSDDNRPEFSLQTE